MRKLLASLALVISLCALSAVPAAAERPEKAPIFGPKIEFPKEGRENCETGPLPTPETFGFLRLNTPGNPTTLSGAIELKHARPNTTYRVLATQGVGDFCLSETIGAITTNKKGNGRLAFTILREQHFGGNSANVLRVGVENEADEELFSSATVRLN